MSDKSSSTSVFGLKRKECALSAYNTAYTFHLLIFKLLAICWYDIPNKRSWVAFLDSF